MQGRDKAARLLAGYATRRGSGLDIRYRRVNGDDSAVVFEGGSPYAVMVMDLTPDGEQVSDVYIVTNPEKLAHVRRDETAACGRARGDGGGEPRVSGSAVEAWTLRRPGPPGG